MPSPRKRPEKPLEKEMAYFVEAHLGKGIFAPFTGTDYAAWKAWCHLLRLYGVCRDPKAMIELSSYIPAVDALRATLGCAQRKLCVWDVFIQTIPGVLDWGFVKEMWPQITEGIVPSMLPWHDREQLTHDQVAGMFAVERGRGDSIHAKHGLGWR